MNYQDNTDKLKVELGGIMNSSGSVDHKGSCCVSSLLFVDLTSIFANTVTGKIREEMSVHFL